MTLTGDQMRRLRIAAGYTQDQLAELVGTDQSEISYVERSYKIGRLTRDRIEAELLKANRATREAAS